MFKPVDSHPDFPKLEKEILEYWEKNRIFEKSLERTKDGEPFVFYEGPPTANGKPGLHHVEARSFKDLIPRYQTMRGRFVARRAGWDTHGLPVELQVEKKLGISGKQEIESLKDTVKESIAYFNELCRKSVWEFKEDWEKLTERMGFWIDMSDPYITYENSYIEKVWGIIKKIYDKGLIYQGHKVVPYCPRCGTALSSHEVAQGYKIVHDESVYVKFKVKDPEKGNLPENTYLLAWTTTPWTLPGNLALAVGKDIMYEVHKAKNKNEYYLIARARVKEVLESNIRVVSKLKGEATVGLEYEPLFPIRALKNENSHKVYPADFVNTEEGTGIVHTAVMYGEDDYKLGEQVGLPKHHTVDEQGKFTDDLKEYGLAGLSVKAPETEKKIIDYLKDNNLLLKSEKYEHEYPFCWRCDSALLYYARDSWFIEMTKQREALQKNNQQINWVPAHIKDGRFGEWIAEAKDWAISRERYWGTPLPIWVCDEGHNTVIRSIEELSEKATNFDEVYPNWKSEIQKPKSETNPNDKNSKPQTNSELDLHRPYIDEIKLKCEKCKGEAKRVLEVMDVWFDSGAMPFASGVRGYPADFISEAIDQTRGWFYTLLAISTLLEEGPAYKNVVSLGLLLDAKGQKMSKSKGNIVNPWDIGNKFGFDILRWYFYSVNQPGDNKLFAEKELQLMQRKVQLILWNVYNYFVTYANDAKWKPDSVIASDSSLRGQLEKVSTTEPINGHATPSDDVAEGFSPPDTRSDINILDQWILARLQQLINQTSERLDSYNTLHASRGIEEFINELSTWYIRRSRGRTDNAFFDTLYEVLVTLSKVLAPFMPYISEKIYLTLKSEIRNPKSETNSKSKIPNSKQPISVHLEDWPEVKKLTKSQENLLTQMAELRNIVEQAHALRAQAGIKLRQPLAKLTLPSSSLRAKRSNPTADETASADPDRPRSDTAYAPRDDILERPPRQARARLGSDRISSIDSIVPPVAGLQNDALLEILKNEINVKEIEFGDKLDLSTEISTELKIEGMAAELTRQINNFRKESGLKIGQMAEVYYEIPSNYESERITNKKSSVPIYRQVNAEMIEKAMEMVDKEKVYASEIASVSLRGHSPKQSHGDRRGAKAPRDDVKDLDVDYEKEIEIEGEKVKLFLKLIT